MRKDQRTPEGNRRGERRPVLFSGRRGQWPVVSSGTDEEAIAHGTSWVAVAAPRPHAGSIDADTADDVPREVVAWSVVVRFVRQSGMQTLGLRRPCNNLRRHGQSTLCQGPSDVAL